jgi:hypothetical protein
MPAPQPACPATCLPVQSLIVTQLKQQLHDLNESQAEDEGRVSTLLGEIRLLQEQQAQLQADRDQAGLELEQAQCQVCGRLHCSVCSKCWTCTPHLMLMHVVCWSRICTV